MKIDLGRYCAIAGMSTETGIVNSLLDLEGVQSVKVLSAPPWHVHFQVEGGDDHDIAWRLYDTVPTTTLTMGNTTGVIECPMTGILREIKFSRLNDPEGDFNVYRPRWWQRLWYWCLNAVTWRKTK